MARGDEETRLGGPPGLFDSPNWDRESNGGIVQRVRVPASSRPEQFWPPGMYQTASLNDSDSGLIAQGGRPEETSAPTKEQLESGIAFRKDITGSKL